MISALHYPSMVHDDYHIRIAYTGQAVSDHYARAILHYLLHGVLNCLFGARVDI